MTPIVLMYIMPYICMSRCHHINYKRSVPRVSASLPLQFAAGDDEGSGGDLPVVHLTHTRTGAA